MDKWKAFAIIQGIAIILILLIVWKNSAAITETHSELISQSISTGVINPKSKLIFNFDPLRDTLQQYISEKKDATIGVYVENLRDGADMGINENIQFEPASLNKLPMAILVLRGVENGKFTLQTELPIRPEDIDTRSGQLYLNEGSTASVDKLLRNMLSDSDNTAFYVLGHVINWSDWQQLSYYLDYYDLRPNPINNYSNIFYTTSPEANSHLFTSLYLSTLLSPEHSEYILQQLKNNTFDIQRISGLPENLTVAQKFGTYYGDNEKWFHNCGIMYIGNSRYFYCVMTKGLPQEEAETTVGHMVNEIYKFIIDTRIQLSQNNPI